MFDSATPKGSTLGIIHEDVLAYVTAIHNLAAPVADRGILIVAGFGEDASSGKKLTSIVTHHKIGDVTGMCAEIERLGREQHRNVYVPLAVFRPDLPQRSKGGEEDIVAVLGLVADFDDAEAPRYADRLPVSPNLVLQTSAQRFQALILFDVPALPAEVKALAHALKEDARCDHGTSDLSHVWRIPGTLNWPNKRKFQAGRSLIPQQVRIVQPLSGVTSVAALKTVLVSRTAPSASDKVSLNEHETDSGPGFDPIAYVEKLTPELRGRITEPTPEGKRSDAIMSVVVQLIDQGQSNERIEAIFRAHPQGIGEKHAGRRDLKKEIERIREKHKASGAGFQMRSDGLWFIEPDDKPPLKLSGPFEILAETRDAINCAWGVLLSWKDHDGHTHEWALPREMLAGDGADYRRVLMDRGMYVAPSRRARELLMNYLASVKVERRARCVDRVGWHGPVYVMPDRSFGRSEDGERVLLQITGKAPEFQLRGSLDGWRNEVAALAVGNTRLVLAISAAFVGPLLHLVGEESGGIHLAGASSIGKSSGLVVAASVWGCPVRSWRTTDNAAEALARQACDSLLCLDELSQADPKAADALGYLLSNGQGKARMRRDASARPPSTWRILFLSSGEVGLAEKVGEIGRRAKAGQSVRLIEVPADAGAGLGLFEDLHGSESGDAFARRLRAGCDAHQGHAASEYVERLSKSAEKVGKAITEISRRWVEKNLPVGADGQVARVAGRFGLVAAAGELARYLGIVSWPEGEAERAAAVCFGAWIGRRGGIGSAEIDTGIRQVRAFLESHGDSRFETIREPEPASYLVTAPRVVHDRAGFKRPDEEGNWEYLILPEAWKNRVCQGFDAAAIAKALKQMGHLDTEPNRRDKSIHIPNVGKSTRVIIVKAGLLTGDHDFAR